ncbi:hypothetical protein SUGI_0893060 [Cryptomeria japonica]|nr:hypothetical protein SUGI_0893060 [Cryptomeria japonica]
MGSKERNWLVEVLQEASRKLNVHQPKNVVFNILSELDGCLSIVEKPPSNLLQLALVPVVTSLRQHSLIRHLDDGIRLMVTSCLSEIIRILAPQVPYDEDTMKEVFYLIVDSFQDLDINNILYSQRVAILNNFAKNRLSSLLIELGLHDLIYNMFHHFLVTINNRHYKEIITALNTIMVMCINESDVLSQPILSMILAIYKQEWAFYCCVWVGQ